MIDLIASWAVRALNFGFRFVPISLSLWCGRRVGSCIFFFHKKRRLIAYANLKAAFAGEKEPAELRRITKRVYQNIAQTFVEMLNLTKVSKRYVDRYVTILNYERMEAAAGKGKGIILLTAHFGDWELSGLVGAVVGHPMTVLARDQKMTRLNELLNRLRESKGCKVVRKGASVKHMIRALHNNETVGILADQDAGKKGVFATFFGRQTSTAQGPFEFSKRTGAIVLPNFIARTGGPYHNLQVEEPIDVDALGIQGAVQRYLGILESYVRRYPDQWLWPHKRWKSTPVRKVLVLSDARAGHLNQALAVAKRIQAVRIAQGYVPSDTEIIVREVRYRNRFAPLALSFCSNFATWRCHGCMRCMKACLERDSYRSLMSTYADFIVSAGSTLAPVNVFMARENNAKNIVVMKQGNVRLGQFSLAVIPKHDRPRRRRNVLIVDTAPNLVDDAFLKRSADALSGKIGTLRKRRIGLLFGGNNQDYRMTVRLASDLIDGALAAARSVDADLLLTTSRRTPPDVEALLKTRLQKEERCKLLVIANETNIPEVVGGILGIAQAIVVSSESISMVSEAVSSGRRVVAFDLEKRRRSKTKQECAIETLVSSGRIAVSPAGAIRSAVEKAFSEDVSSGVVSSDAQAIYDACARLI